MTRNQFYRMATFQCDSVHCPSPRRPHQPSDIALLSNILTNSKYMEIYKYKLAYKYQKTNGKIWPVQFLTDKKGANHLPPSISCPIRFHQPALRIMMIIKMKQHKKKIIWLKFKFQKRNLRTAFFKPDLFLSFCPTILRMKAKVVCPNPLTPSQVYLA